MKHRILGKDLSVSALGLGCMGMSHAYGPSNDESGSIATLHRAAFTPRQLSPFEERELLDLGYGITNVVERGTAAADELTADELARGAAGLRRKIKR